MTNDEANGTHVLVAVLFRDIETQLLVREEPLHLPPGGVVNVMSIPAGLYEVVGVFEDWTHVPVPPAPPWSSKCIPTSTPRRGSGARSAIGSMGACIASVAC